MDKNTSLIFPFDFKQLISPLDPQEFFSKYWERTPLVLNNRQAKGYEGLISLKDVDFLLSSLSSSIAFYNPCPLVKFINNKKILRLENYLNTQTGYLDMKKIFAGFKDGNTILLNSLQLRCEPARKLTSALEDVFGHPVSAAMFLTPANSQGSGPHHDPQDVFILQLEGEKLWKVYNERVEFPIAEVASSFQGTLTSPLHEVHLNPGDLLYIPRGYYHEARTENKYSLHLTVAIRSFTWLDLIQKMAYKIPSLRRALPPKILFADGIKDGLPEELQHLERLEFEKTTIVEAFEELRAKFSEVRTSSFENHFTILSDIDKITEKTLFRKKSSWKIVSQEDRILMYCEKNGMSVSSRLEPLLQYMEINSNFDAQSLPSFSLKDRLVLLRSLVHNGFLDFATLPSSEKMPQ